MAMLFLMAFLDVLQCFCLILGQLLHDFFHRVSLAMSFQLQYEGNEQFSHILLKFGFANSPPLSVKNFLRDSIIINCFCFFVGNETTQCTSAEDVSHI